MIGALSLNAIPIALVSAKAAERRYAVVCCGQCGNATGSANARICTRTDCGLPDRSHTGRNAA